MTVKYLLDENGNITDVQLSLQDYLSLLEKANEYPAFVKTGIKRGQEQAQCGKTKTTEDVMLKYS